MDRLGARAPGYVDELCDREVGFRGRVPAESERFVCEAGVHRGAIGIRVDGDRTDLELAQGPEDPHSDLTTVRDQDLREHDAYSPGR